MAEEVVIILTQKPKQNSTKPTINRAKDNNDDSDSGSDDSEKDYSDSESEDDDMHENKSQLKEKYGMEVDSSEEEEEEEEKETRTPIETTIDKITDMSEYELSVLASQIKYNRQNGFDDTDINHFRELLLYVLSILHQNQEALKTGPSKQNLRDIMVQGCEDVPMAVQVVDNTMNLPPYEATIKAVRFIFKDCLRTGQDKASQVLENIEDKELNILLEEIVLPHLG